LYPALEHMATERRGDYVEFASSSSPCLFLEKDNLCRIEKEQGGSLKPTVCRLFPFNAFRRIGHIIAVSPHFLCPLRMQVPARPGEVEGTHSLVEAGIRESEILDDGYIVGLRSLAFHPSTEPDRVLIREERFRNACSAAIGELSFYEVLQGESEAPFELDSFIERAAPILGLRASSKPRGRDHVDDMMLALASPFRLELLFLPSEAILRALALAGVLLRRALSIFNDAPDLKGAIGLLSNLKPAMCLLALGGEPLTLKPSIRIKAPDLGDPDLTMTAAAVLDELRASVAPLNALEKSIPAMFTVSDRSILLAQLGALIEKAVVLSQAN
ncbi:MAG TPA: YkgJ family cysteine cluster protein, partial [Blastocatellia bacterium]|nr:YkgJ family cysteine cluster protein [Blastocatellia bacterium]